MAPSAPSFSECPLGGAWVALAGGFACKLLLGASDWNFLLCPHLLFVCRCFVCFYILRFYDLCVCVQLFVQS